MWDMRTSAMQDNAPVFDPDLADLPQGEWLHQLAATAETNGFFRNLGKRHFAAHVRRGDTLLVTFETLQGIRALSETAEPLGWDLVRSEGWSHLCIAANGDTWFRDRAVFALFDDLSDEGFFDEYDQVLFYGAGPGGYAAAAFSVAAPGARVLAIQPQATLDPRVTEWDDRFIEMRRTDFTDRYGYAPDMLDACTEAFVLYDPVETLDAMHGALFTCPRVTKLRLRHMGDALQTDLMAMQILLPMLQQAAEGHLSAHSFATLYRARRKHTPYLRRMMAALDSEGREDLVYALARNVVSRMKGPRFKRRMDEIEAKRAMRQEETGDAA